MSNWMNDLEKEQTPEPPPPEPELTPEAYIKLIFQASGEANLRPWFEGLKSCKIPPSQLDPNGYSLLHLSAWFGDLSLVKILISEYSFPIDIRSSNNQTPLSLASARGYLSILKYLLDHGAEPESSDNAGMTPILCAAHNGQILAWYILKNRGCAIWTKDKEGNSALHLAASKNHVNMIRVLISQDFSIEEVNLQGMTPLHKAAEHGSLETICHLLHQQCKVDVVDSKQRTPAMLADSLEVQGPSAMIYNYGKFNLFYDYFPLFYHFFWVSVIITYVYEIFQDTVLCLGGNLIFSLTLASVIPLYWWVKNTNSQVLRPADEDSIEKRVIESFESGKLDEIPKQAQVCFTCQIIRPQKSKHCRYTDQCIEEYDHYNYFLKKPIGKGNRKIYVLGLYTNLLSATLFNYLFIKKLGADVEYEFFSKYFMTIVQNYFKAFAGVQLLVVVNVLFHWFVFWCFVMEVICISQGLTANEALYRHRYLYLFKAQEYGSNVSDPKSAVNYRVVYSNPNNKGFLANWVEFLVS